MAVSLTTVTGPIYLPNVATPIGGRVSFELSSWDQEEGEGLIISGPVYSTIDDNGEFSVNLFTSTAGVRSVHYRMFVIWEDSELSESYVNNIYVGAPTPHYTKKYIGSFALSGPGPFRVSDLNIISEVNNSSFDAYIEMKAFADRIDLGALDAAVLSTATDRLDVAANTLIARESAEVSEANKISAIASSEAAEIANISAQQSASNAANSVAAAELTTRTHLNYVSMITALPSLSSEVMQVSWYTTPRVVVSIVRSTGATILPDALGWVPKGQWTVYHWGAQGDGNGSGGGTDDTAAIQAALNALGQGNTLVFPSDGSNLTCYNVTRIVFDATSTIWSGIKFEYGVRLYGVATTPQPAIFDFIGAQKCKIENLYIMSDGNQDVPTYMTNYGSAMRWLPRLAADGYSGVDRACQFLTFQGGVINGFRRGLVIGELEGLAPRGNVPMSENTLEGIIFSGCERAVLMNARRGFVELRGCIFVSQNLNAADWWSNDNGYVIRADVGSVAMNGGEIQRAIATGHTFYCGEGDDKISGEIAVSTAVYEAASGSYIGRNGMLRILDVTNGYISPQTHSRFVFGTNSTGHLELRGGRLEKNNSTNALFGGLLVDASAAPLATYQISTTLRGMEWNNTNPLFIGGIPYIKHLRMETATVDVATLEYLPNGDSWDSVVATPNGDSMTTTMDNTTKGGWTMTGAGAANSAFGRYTGPLPEGSASAIWFQQSVGQVFLSTPAGTAAMRMKGHERTLHFKVMNISDTVFLGVQMQFYDALGASLGIAVDRFALNTVSFTTYNANGVFQKLIIPMNAPLTARFARVLLRGGSTGQAVNVAVTDFKIV